jgi:hypothetical protein
MKEAPVERSGEKISEPSSLPSGISGCVHLQCISSSLKIPVDSDSSRTPSQNGALVGHEEGTLRWLRISLLLTTFSDLCIFLKFYFIFVYDMLSEGIQVLYLI